MDTKNRVERDRFLRKLAVIAEVYGKQLSRQTIEAYLESLSSYPIDRIEKAMDTILRERPSGLYFPTPADIIEVVKSTTIENPATKLIAHNDFVPNQEQRKWLTIQEKYVWWGWAKHNKDKSYVMSKSGMRQFAIEQFKIDPDWYDSVAKQIPDGDDGR